MDPVALVGSGPATDVVAAALDDESIPHERREDPDLADATLGVVVDRVGSESFERADDAAPAAGVPWIAVELGGIGGYPIVEASVAGLEPEGPCYRCLSGRVEANAPADAEPVAAPGGPTARLAGAQAGSALADLLDPDRALPIDRSRESILGRVIEVPHAEREVLSLPGCGCGPDADSDLRRGGDSLDLEAALASGERGLDDRVGIVAQVGEAESYPAPYYLAEL
jgi:ribosomal protein S12 methylthiotransferase accessory factor